MTYPMLQPPARDRRSYVAPAAASPRPLPRVSHTVAQAPVFLTVAEVAARWRVSKMTVYRLVHAGELATVRVGRSFRIREDSVDAYQQRDQLP